MATKLDVVNEICDLLLIDHVHMSTGSTEPRELFDRAIEMLGLDGSEKFDKTGSARHIVESSGGAWLPHFESRGGTVTLSGLLAVRDAVRFFLAA